MHDTAQVRRDSGVRPGAGVPAVVQAVVQARMRSTRLPGKALRLLGGHPVLDWVVRSAQSAPGVDRVVVATSDEAGDDPIATRADSLGVAVVRGDADDVLARFLTAVDAHPCDAVVRLTADCPLLDPSLIALVVAAWRQEPSYDYVATTLVRTLPRGLDVELATARALRDLDGRARDHHRVHVTSGLYTDPDRYRLLGLVVSPAADDLRVTLDTEADGALLDGLVDALGGRTGWREIVATLRGRPDLVARNAEVVQKALEAG